MDSTQEIDPLTSFSYSLPSKVSCLLPMRVILEKMLRSSSSRSSTLPVSPEAPRMKQLLFCCLKFSSRVFMSSAMLCVLLSPVCSGNNTINKPLISPVYEIVQHVVQQWFAILETENCKVILPEFRLWSTPVHSNSRV